MRNSEKCFVFNYAAGYYKDAWLRNDVPWQHQLECGEEAMEYRIYSDQIKAVKKDINHVYNQDYFVFNNAEGTYWEHVRFKMVPSMNFLSQVANRFSPHANILSYENDREMIESIKRDMDLNRK